LYNALFLFETGHCNFWAAMTLRILLLPIIEMMGNVWRAMWLQHWIKELVEHCFMAHISILKIDFSDSL
jgi:hypothetical protein